MTDQDKNSLKSKELLHKFIEELADEHCNTAQELLELAQKHIDHNDVLLFRHSIMLVGALALKHTQVKNKRIKQEQNAD